MKTIEQLPKSRLDEFSINTAIAFYVLERNNLLNKSLKNAIIQKKINDFEFIIDELAIKALEEYCIYTC